MKKGINSDKPTTIDGRRTLGELATVTGLETRAVAKALRALHKENCIRMYDAAGQLVESARLA